jgi:GMP synthase (glutamine-hydrolysing)
MTEHILIVDFGAQYTQLIARRVREAGVYSEIVPFTAPRRRCSATACAASSCPAGRRASPRRWRRAPRRRSLPSACPFSASATASRPCVPTLGGKVEVSDHREFGRAFLEVVGRSPLFDGVWAKGERHQVWMSHGDRVMALPDGFQVIGVSEGAPFAAIADDKRALYGVQFHPEVMHTPDGARLIANFVIEICGCRGDWTMASFKDDAIHRIKRQVGFEPVICGLSGGVDSAVTAVLLHEAIGEQLTCIFVDHGLLRQDEAEEVVRLFREAYNIPLVHVDASKVFLEALAGMADPEDKRRTIGKLFIDMFEAEAKKVGGAAFLAQGTLYPDVIESVSFTGGPSVTIKSHHNVGGLPERMNMQLVEPLRELFKDEVRVLGRELGLPGHFVRRHPFPGPGLAIRVPGAVSREKLDILRKADAIFLDEIRKSWPLRCHLAGVRGAAAGPDCGGHGRCPHLRIRLRAAGGDLDRRHDGGLFPLRPRVPGRTATRIINEVRGINRVVYDVTSNLPAPSSGNESGRQDRIEKAVFNCLLHFPATDIILGKKTHHIEPLAAQPVVVA